MLSVYTHIDPTVPFLGRAVGKAVVSALTYAMFGMAQQAVRIQKMGAPQHVEDNPVPELEHEMTSAVINGHHVGVNSEALAAGNREQSYEEMDEKQRDMQGAQQQMSQMELASIDAAINATLTYHLVRNAGRVVLKSDPTKQMPNPFDIPQSLDQTFEFMLNRAPAIVSEATLKAEAAFLGVTIDDIKRNMDANNTNQRRFLMENGPDIIAWVKNIDPADGDLESLEARLPVINQERIWAAADRGLWNQRSREISNFTRANPIPALRDNAPGNIAMIDGYRVKLLSDYDEWVKNPKIAASLDEATLRGVSRPTWNQRPVKAPK